MSRYVIQSKFTGCFLAPSPEDGQPFWVTLLSDAVSVQDEETAAEIIYDHLDSFHQAIIINLDLI